MSGILVVEDDENLNRGITFSLKKSGYEVFSAESVKKAKRIASDNNMTGNTKESTTVIFLRYLFVTALPPDSIYTQDL